MTGRLLHVLNGDSTAAILRQTRVPGTLTVWADVLHEGPVPGLDVPPERWREIRARFLAAAGFATYDDALRLATEWDRALEGYAAFDEVVLWFEHDLFDQLILARHLGWFAQRDLGRTRLSLICIGAFPGVVPFHGLGQLAPHQLASLLDAREPVTARQIELGRAVWRAFTGPDPMRLARLLERDTSALPFLAGALRRLLQEFPAVENGLPRSERHILEILAADPAGLVGTELFRTTQAKEERVFMGDVSFRWRVRQLGRGPYPLVVLDGDLVRITPEGRDVLARTSDWVHRNGIDRWIGGVHLAGREVPWRWHEGAGRLRGPEA